MLLTSVRHYRDVLNLNPQHKDARHNLELIRLFIKHIQSQWAERDRQRDREEKDLLQFILMLEEKEAKANAQILEMVGDLPTADSEAPDNVLFVCKLNPVTSGDDLEVIFSRFGNIVSCEVIKDQIINLALRHQLHRGKIRVAPKPGTKRQVSAPLPACGSRSMSATT